MTNALQVLVDLAELQDREVGDGTTSVVIIAAELLKVCVCVCVFVCVCGGGYAVHARAFMCEQASLWIPFMCILCSA